MPSKASSLPSPLRAGVCLKGSLGQKEVDEPYHPAKQHAEKRVTRLLRVCSRCWDAVRLERDGCVVLLMVHGRQSSSVSGGWGFSPLQVPHENS